MKSLLSAALLTCLLAVACGGEPTEEKEPPGEILTEPIWMSYVVDGANVYYSAADGVYVLNLETGSANMLASIGSYPHVAAVTAGSVIVVDDTTEPDEVHAIPVDGGASWPLGTGRSARYRYYGDDIPIEVDGSLVYWLKGDEVVSGAPTVAESVVASSVGDTTALAIDEASVYVSIVDAVQYADQTPNSGSIISAPKNATAAVPTVLHDAGGFATHLAVGGDTLFWAYQYLGAWSIRRKPLSGGLPPLDLEVGLTRVTDLVADAAGAYVALFDGTLLRIEGDAMRIVTTDAMAPLQLTREHIYFGCRGDRYSDTARLCRLPR